MKIEFDWVEVGTAEELERVVGNRFKFRGIGWYKEAKDTLLVVPVDRNLNGPFDAETVYELFCWNCPFEDTIFGQINEIEDRT